MSVSIGPLDGFGTTLAMGSAILIFGLLVWHVRGIIKIRFGKVMVWLPSSPWAGRLIVASGALLLAGAFLMPGAPGPASASPRPQAPPGSAASASPPAAGGPASPRPATPRPHGSDRAAVRILPPYGTGSLGRDVVAVGQVGRTGYACYAVGWYVVTAAEWTGYFIPVLIRPGANGAFRTPILHMGSPGETGSSWYPFILGASQAAAHG